jgi:hypothetical protein
MFCSKCGAKNDADDLFCYKCGSRFHMTGSPESMPAAAKAAQVRMASGGGAPGPRSKKSHKGLVIGIAAAVIVVAAAVVGYKLLWQPAADESAASNTGVLSGADNENAPAGETDGVSSLRYSLVSGIYELDFSTPEEAIEHFVAAVADNNYKEAMAACAVNEAAENFDAAAFAARRRAVMYNMGAPSEYEFYQTLNRAFYLNQITFQLKFFTYSFFDSDPAEALCNGENYPLQDYENEAAQFVADVDPAMLRELKIIRIDLPHRELFNSEEHQDILAGSAIDYGADEAADRIVLYELDGKTYYSGFLLMRYGGSWKIYSLDSPLGGATAYGTAEEITENAYLDMLD